MDERSLSLTELIHDRSFCALLRFSQQRAMTWDTFLQHPLPPNMSPLAVWSMLEAIGQCIGVHLFQDAKNNILWYRRTHELSDIADAIERCGSRGSPLCGALLDNADSFFAFDLRIVEYAAALGIAGFDVDSGRLKMHMKLGTTPKVPLERIIVNAVRIDQDLAEFADEPFSASLLARFRSLLVEGLEADEVDSLSATGGKRALDERSWDLLRQQIDRVTEYAERKLDDQDITVMQGNLVADAIRFYGFYGPLSSPIASLASRLFYLKHDLLGLALVPVSHVKLEWLKGRLADRTLCSPSEHEDTLRRTLLGPSEYEGTLRRTCCDLTVHHTLAAQCMQIALDETESRIVEMNGLGDAARAMLSSDRRFNYRQRTILVRALRAPQAEFRIRYHQEKHRVSYATARRDFVELEEAGYLRSEQRGKAFVFVADKGIEELSRKLKLN